MMRWRTDLETQRLRRAAIEWPLWKGFGLTVQCSDVAGLRRMIVTARGVKGEHQVTAGGGSSSSTNCWMVTVKVGWYPRVRRGR
jgi:hypothetical protein